MLLITKNVKYLIRAKRRIGQIVLSFINISRMSQNVIG